MWPFSRKPRSEKSAPSARVPEPSALRPMSRQARQPPISIQWGKPANTEPEGAEPARFSPITLSLLQLPAEGRVPVVGESYYQQALRFVTRGATSGNTFDDHIPVTAALVPEPYNPWDKTAVRIDVVLGQQSVKVGYLSRELARLYHAELIKILHSGRMGTCPGRITGGGRKYYGIYLHLSDPRSLRIANGSEHPAIAQEQDGVAILHGERTCAVTQGGKHQDVLQRYAPADRQGRQSVTASLHFCVIGSGKYRGKQAIEVRLRGRRIGQLTYATTLRYRGIVQEIIDRGSTATCQASIRNTDKGIQVELLMPSDPDHKPSFN
ncbi:hypothetical protein UA74_17940 [Actinoalloteichus fjordicus]|uniref:HIRAN domain-containing protein n=2 Tax=Actinoalloteichus fjordicus TaxID=1612552 RepID=A0AAC9LDG4_9PSEU|nr:hypothetical protein UA74_17940 [Actinoalloteichus fjordicus]